MLKLVHTGLSWFMEYECILYCRDDYCSDLGGWDEVKELAKVDFEILEKEFPVSLGDFQYSPNDTNYCLKARSTSVHVHDVTAVDSDDNEIFDNHQILATVRKDRATL